MTEATKPEFGFRTVPAQNPLLRERVCVGYRLQSEEMVDWMVTRNPFGDGVDYAKGAVLVDLANGETMTLSDLISKVVSSGVLDTKKPAEEVVWDLEDLLRADLKLFNERISPSERRAVYRFALRFLESHFSRWFAAGIDPTATPDDRRRSVQMAQRFQEIALGFAEETSETSCLSPLPDRPTEESLLRCISVALIENGAFITTVTGERFELTKLSARILEHLAAPKEGDN